MTHRVKASDHVIRILLSRYQLQRHSYPMTPWPQSGMEVALL